MSGHFVEVCEIHGTRYGSCRCIGPHEERRVPCIPARCAAAERPKPAAPAKPPVSAEPRVLLEWEWLGMRFRLAESDSGRSMEVRHAVGSWFPVDYCAGMCAKTAGAVYDAMRAKCAAECASADDDPQYPPDGWLVIGPLDAMRAREVRE